MLRSLPERFKVDIRVKEGSHASENAGMSFIGLTRWMEYLLIEMTVNRQLNDKERVAGQLMLVF